MSKRSVKKNKEKANVNKNQVLNKAPVSKKKKLLKNIGLGVFLTLGTIIIIAAAFIIYAIFASDNIDNTKPVSSLEEFINVYEQNEFERDLPDSLVLTEQSLWIDTENHTYTITVGMKCNAEYERQLLLQLFYPAEFVNYKNGIKNPFITVDENDGMVLSNDIERYTVTGTYSKELSTDELASYLENIYMEVKLGNEMGRVMLPLDVYIE